MKLTEESKMQKAEHNDVHEIIDCYLSEEDKDLICSKKSSSKMRSFPGNELFQLYSEANRVKEFCANGHHLNVKGFGVDYLLNREFSNEWLDEDSDDGVEAKASELLMDMIDDGYIVDDDQVDKIYAWITMSPYQLMSMTESIRNQLCRTVDLLWDMCVMKSKAFSTQSNDTAANMMKDIVMRWSETVVIPHRGVGKRNLLD